MSNSRYLLGIDIGTSGVKAVLFDQDGRSVSKNQQEYHFYNPKPGLSEIDPEEVWQKTVAVIKKCVLESGYSNKQIVAMGLSVLGETTMPLDEKGNPLHPAIDSQDKRDNGYETYLSWFEKQFGAENIFQRTSYPLAFIAPALRLLWFRDHRPDIFKKIHKFVTFQDFAIWRLTGSPAIDHSMASRTLIFDAQRKIWVKEYLDAMQVPSELLSTPCPSMQPVGTLTESAARELGLSPGTLVVPGAHDQSCASLGIGGVREGIASDGTGSVEAISTPTKTPFTSADLQSRGFSSECHLYPDLYLAVGFHLTAGTLVRWYRDQLGQWEQENAKDIHKDVYDLITEAARESPPGANGLLILPHWSGAGVGHFPMLNPASRGAILGLTLAHTKGDINRAIFEGITFEARLIVDTFKSIGIPIETFVVTGGGAKSSFWLQLKADIIGKPMVVPQTTEASALGAAILAGVGVGIYQSLEQAVERVCHNVKVFEPDPIAMKTYNRIFPIYCDLYDAVIGITSRLSLLAHAV